MIDLDTHHDIVIVKGDLVRFCHLSSKTSESPLHFVWIPRFQFHAYH